jgi:hypothetical protein
MKPHARSLGRRTALARSACFSPLVAVLAVASSSAWALGQCGPGWQQVVSGGGGLNSIAITSVRFDPDGSGPQPPVLAVGGGFTTAGSVAANFIATWDPAANIWAPLGSGLGGTVESLAVMPNGDLVAGGNFATAGGATANYVARWSISSQTWSPMSTGMNDVVLALAVQPNGDLIAGGTFSMASGVRALYVARWNQAAAGGAGAWEPIGSGMDSNVNALVVLPNGDLIAGGNFSSAGGLQVSRIARLGQGSSVWSPVSTGFSSNVYALAVMPNEDIIAGGIFTTAGPNTVNYIARYSTGAALWTALGGGVDNTVWSLAVLPGGDIAVGGSFNNAGGTPANGIARWSEASGTWSAIGSSNTTNGKVSTILTTPNGELYAGGYFTVIGGSPAPYFARFSTGGTPLSITSQPLPQSACPSAAATFSITAAGTGPFTYEWQWQPAGPATAWINLAAGDNADAGGVPVVNAANVATASLETRPLAGYVNFAPRAFRCIVTSSCGSVTSNAATLTVTACRCSPADIANTDGDVGFDGAIDNGDFTAFFNAFFLDADDPNRLAADIANTDGETTVEGAGPDGAIDNGDFTAFFNFFFQGCATP